MLIRSSALFLIALIPSVAFCQPAPVAPPKPPGYDCVDMDGVGGLSPNDFMAFQNAYVARSAYDAAVTLQTPPAQPSGLTATVAGTLVTLKWTNPLQPWTNGYLVRGTTVIPFTVNTTQLTDSPGAGQWTYSVTVRNVVSTGSYPGTFAPTGNPPAASATVQGTQPPPGTGWTDISLPPGAIAVYVSTSGNDANSGTQASPLRTLSAGYAKLRDGQPDQLLLKCGDAFPITSTLQITKGSGSSTKWMVIGSYGTGPRPKLVGPNPFNAEEMGKRGIAFVGLEMSNTRIVGSYCFRILGWQDVLIEDCAAHDTFRCLIYQGINNVRGKNLKFRRNQLWDITAVSADPAGSSNSSQAIYSEKHDDWLIEGNSFHNPGVAATVFSRPIYVQSDSGPGIMRANVFANSPAEGFQIRAGNATVENNIILDCPMAAWIGGTNNTITLNTVLGSGSVGPNGGRWGVGLQFNGLCTVRWNILGYCSGFGWGNAQGYWAEGASGVCSDNYAYNWSRDPAWQSNPAWVGGAGNDPAECWSIKNDSGTAMTFSNNRIFSSRQSIIGGGALNGTGNSYFEPSGGMPAFRPNDTAPGWSKLNAMPTDPDLKGKLPGGSINAYVLLLRGQSRQTWRDDLMPENVNTTLRQAAGVGNPGGNP